MTALHRVKRPHSSPRRGQFSLSSLLMATTLAPLVFGLYAGAFGAEAQLAAALLALAVAGIVLYLGCSLLALAAVYCLPLAVWQCCRKLQPRQWRSTARHLDVSVRVS